MLIFGIRKTIEARATPLYQSVRTCLCEIFFQNVFEDEIREIALRPLQTRKRHTTKLLSEQSQRMNVLVKFSSQLLFY